jgi:UDP-N-acetylglucosamine:LPS N-acetylglucosamine transferase
MNTLIFTTSEGHLSIAQALQSFLKEQSVTTQLIYRDEPGLALYRFIYKYVPKAFPPIFQFSKTFIASFWLKHYTLLEHSQTVQQIIRSEKPEVVFNTSFGFTSSLVQTHKNHPFTFLNIVPNPRTFFRQDLSPLGINCMFDDKTIKSAQHYFPSAKFVKTGWFVRPEFEKKYDQNELRKELDLQTSFPLLLFVTGSEGTETVLETIRSLKDIEKVSIIVACGHNNQLVKKANSLAKTVSFPLRGIGFTDQIYKYMQAADLVIGKAGPNMLFESIATYTPFFATTHVGGLEDGNLDIIKDYDVGFVEEKTDKATQLIRQLIEHPEHIAQKLPQVKKLAEYNKTQRENLLKYFQS